MGAMTVTLCNIIESVQCLRHSKWHWDIRHFSDCLGITVEQANSFIKCVEIGGTGTKADCSWRTNPKPYDTKMNLTGQYDNVINLHYKDMGDKTVHIERFIRLGRISSQNKKLQ